MRVKRTVWVFTMIALTFVLVLIVNSRVGLTSEIIVGGSDSVFVESDSLRGELDDYNSYSKTDLEKYEDLDFPDIDITAWRYVLINSDNPRNAYAPGVKRISGTDIYFDADALVRLEAMLDAMSEEGFEPYICNGYVSYSDQKILFNEKASSLSSDGAYSYEEALELTKSLVPEAGTSDHQTGLAVDITDKEYSFMDYSKMDKEFFKWLDEHCAEYGFIKRFPSEKKAITGWDEPWHYRYVGKDAAEFITANNMTFEEFVAHYTMKSS